MRKQTMSNTTIPTPVGPAAFKYDLRADLDYFIANQNELVEKYDGKELVIVNQHVEAAYDTVGEAYTWGIDNFGRDGFSIRKCIPGPEAYTAIIRRPRTSAGASASI